MIHLIMIFLRPMFASAVRRVLKNRLSSAALNQVIQNTWRNYGDLKQDIPAEPTFGARVMVNLAAVAAGFYKSLTEEGLTTTEAGRFTPQVTWLVYEKMAGPPWKFTVLLAKNPIARTRRAMDIFMHFFPYRSPGYQMKYVKTEEGSVAFDVYRCPVSEYFAGKGLSELCVNAFCNLDYPLADKWGVELIRPLTLAAGAAYCNFKYRPKSKKKE